MSSGVAIFQPDIDYFVAEDSLFFCWNVFSFGYPFHCPSYIISSLPIIIIGVPNQKIRLRLRINFNRWFKLILG